MNGKKRPAPKVPVEKKKTNKDYLKLNERCLFSFAH